jgi:5-methyltetrahydrofolate--homocysteine methyltransferase
VDLRTLLKSDEVILLDGAMGTQLTQRCGDEGGHLSLTHPEQVKEIHRSYVKSGSRVITSNSLTMNRLYIETHGLSVDVKHVNHASVNLARSSVKEGQLVLGDMSSTGKLLAPYGDYSEGEFVDVFREQASCLADVGVDGFIIETMFDLHEALCAVKACREVSSLPILATISFNTAEQGGRTLMGNTAADCTQQLERAGVDALGANCGSIDPYQMADIVRICAGVTSLPIIAQPNAGIPRLEHGRTIFDMDVVEFARGIKRCIINGARLVGGCCGTTPDHIRAIRNIL